MGNVPSLNQSSFFFKFYFYLLIDFVVLLFGMGLEAKGEETD